MKRNKKRYIRSILMPLVITGMLMSILIPSAVAVTEYYVGQISYNGEIASYGIDGNRQAQNLVFHNATSGGNAEDVEISYIAYLSSANKTYFKFKSKPVSIDWTFVNDIKSYYFRLTTTNDFYKINVDYTGVVVPPPPGNISYLYTMLQEKNETIANLTQQVEGLQANLTIQTELVNIMESELNISKVERDEAVTNYTGMIENFTVMEKNIGNLQNDKENITKKYDKKKSEYDNISAMYSIEAWLNSEAQKTVKSFGVWTTGYSIQEQQTDGGYEEQEVFYFSAIWFLIGMIPLFVIIIYKYDSLIKKKNKDEGSDKGGLASLITQKIHHIKPKQTSPTTEETIANFEDKLLGNKKKTIVQTEPEKPDEVVQNIEPVKEKKQASGIVKKVGDNKRNAEAGDAVVTDDIQTRMSELKKRHEQSGE